MSAKQQIHVEIPAEHLPIVMNAAIAEKRFGFERRLNGNKFEWRGRLRDGGMSEWSEALPAFASDLNEGIPLLQLTCRELNMGYNIIYSPVKEAYGVVVLQALPDGNARAKFQLSGRPLPELIAGAICQVMEVDVAAWHRDLYPGHYILLNS